ncbi:hypothetical protein CK214_12160 [Mesorhizobium sp. WSM3882]|nr:hypothetical protein CK214_12160 [Mesorhizobium sp. WSM3882]
MSFVVGGVSGQRERLRSFAPPSALPGISPTWGEIGSLGAPAQTCEGGGWRKRWRSLISPLVGEMSGRTEGGAVPPAYRSLSAPPPSRLRRATSRGEPRVSPVLRTPHFAAAKK